MPPYLIVTGDLVKTGGMDRANYALASYLARQGHEVHVVAYRVAKELLDCPNLRFHRVPKIAHSYFISSPLLNRFGRSWARKLGGRHGRVIVNGGNCFWNGCNWVHYVHAAYKPDGQLGPLRKLKNELAYRGFLNSERRALQSAQVILANSETTKRALVERVGINNDKIVTIYYGIDPDRFDVASAEQRPALRAKFHFDERKKLVAFIGALGDSRKGFDIVFSAWKMLQKDPDWDADLVVIGSGAELERWKSLSKTQMSNSTVHFLGFRREVPDLLKMCNVLVAPSRYEAYGLAVQEALACGLPAFVSASAGVAERYSKEMQDLLIRNPDDPADLAKRLRQWFVNPEKYERAVSGFSQSLRSFTWDHMAAKIVQVLATAA